MGEAWERLRRTALAPVLGRPRWHWWAGVAALALAARIAYWAYAGTRVGWDTAGYLGTCAALAGDPLAALRGGIGLEYLTFTAPLCSLVALDAPLSAWVLLQVLGSTLACVLLFDAGMRLAGPAAGLAAGASSAVLWETLQWDVYVLSDSLFVTALAFTLWSLVRWYREPTPRRRTLAWAGLAWLALARPVGLPMLLAWAAFDLLPGRRPRLFGHPAAAAALLALAVLLSAAVSARPSWGEDQVLGKWRDGVLVDADPAFTYPYAPRPGEGVLGFALANADHLAAMAALKLGLLALPVAPRFSTLHNAVNVVTLAPLLVLGAAGALHALRHRPEAARLLLPPVAVVALLCAATFIDYDWRYRAPLGPPLALLGGLAAAASPRLAGLRARLAARVRATPEEPAAAAN